METQDIIGEEFEFFKYQSVPHLSWDEKYDKYIGSKAVAKSIHNRYPQFVLVQVDPTIGSKFMKHFPIDQLREQIEKNKRENMSIDDILSEVKQLTSQI